MLLSGLIFPLASMAAGVRWIAYLLPLTYFTEIARGVMLRGAPIASLWLPFVFLALLAAVVSPGRPCASAGTFRDPRAGRREPAAARRWTRECADARRAVRRRWPWTM